MNNINILFDGMEIPEELLGCLKEVIYDDNQIIMKFGTKIVTNFVGYIEIEYCNTEYRFFSFPKHYRIKNLGKDMKKVVATIESSFKNNEVSNDGFYLSQFNALNNIINYYNEHGLYVEKKKNTVVKVVGKINFKKTTKKITPLYDDNSFLYDKYIVTKQRTNETIITDCMAYIIEIGCRKYDFYFNQIRTNHFYNPSIFKNRKLLLNQLYKVRINIFKDEEKKLVDNIIEYFKNLSLSSSCISNICTTNYEAVYEHMVHGSLSKIKGSKFIKNMFYINETMDDTFFIPDHLDIENKIIADSKYYTNDINNDYKQLFYLQHIANKYISSNDYTIRLKEVNKWVNFLIIPKTNYECKQLVKRNSIDGLNLFTLYIDINDLINCYNEIDERTTIEFISAIKKMRELNHES